MLTNNRDIISDLSIDPHLLCPAFSDHFIISFSMSTTTSKPPPRYALTTQGRLPGSFSYLLDADFNSCLNSFKIETAWHEFSTTQRTAKDFPPPKVRIRSYQRPRWITPNLKHQLNSLNMLRRKSKSHPSSTNLNKLITS